MRRASSVRYLGIARIRRFSNPVARAGPQLGRPGCCTEAEPYRRQEHVEDEVAEDEQEPPERQARERDPALLAQVTGAAGRAMPGAAERRLPRSPVRPVLVAHVAATRLRFSTSRMIRIAV